ncbi:hypothetical protein [Chryseobacterium nematophagum]|nr:hypothetical protein [Chryseobacterium nematophagum]
MITILSPMFSCSYIVDEMYLHDAQNNYISPYQGKWVGSYIGDMNGTIILNVSKSGDIEVIRLVNGNIEETYFTSLLGGGSGALNPSPSPISGFRLYGSLETKSGTWKQQNIGGSWTVTKQ